MKYMKYFFNNRIILISHLKISKNIKVTHFKNTFPDKNEIIISSKELYFIYSLIETIIFTSDALRRAFAVAALRVALRIAIVQYPPGGIERTIRLHG